jgi:hypothetical protein
VSVRSPLRPRARPSTGRVPFTPSHAAAVLPFLRIRVAGAALPASALVCGSMAPDVPYYLWMPFGERSTHSIGGAFGVDVVLAGVVWVLWHGLVAAPALAGLPYEYRARLVAVPVGLRRRLRSVRDVVTLYVAFAIGALTHVVWDSFTHPHRWGTNHIHALNDVYVERPLSHWLQLASTGVGLLVLGAYGLVRWRALPRAGATDLSPISVGATAGWLGVAAAGCVGAVVGAVQYAGGGTGHGLSYVLITRTVSAAALVAVAVCATWRVTSSGRPHRPPTARGPWRAARTRRASGPGAS